MHNGYSDSDRKVYAQKNDFAEISDEGSYNPVCDHPKEDSRHHHSHSKHQHKPKSKLRRFLKKKKKLLINILLILIALVFLVAVLILNEMESRGYDEPTQQQGAVGNSVNSTTDSILIQVPFFTEEVLLTGPEVQALASRDLSVPLADVIGKYKEADKRLDIGQSVTLSFEVKALPEHCSVRSTIVEIFEDNAATASRVYTLDSDEKSVNVYYLKTDTYYSYRISITLSDGSVTSVQGSFKTADTPRILSIDGLVNVRDIGGWKTTDGNIIRQGLLYRGSELDGAVEPGFSITPSGVNDMITILGIRTDMDMRSPSDNVYGVNALGAGVKHIYYNAPMYMGALSNTEPVRKIFSDLANEDKYPVYLHCTYGVDRTGTICYLLEALLGVKEDDLMREYGLSALYYGGGLSESMAEFVSALGALEGETMQQKVEGYLLSIGVTVEEIARIKAVFLEN